MSIKAEIKRFFKGFRYAFDGVVYCIKTQRNMRFHIGAAVIAAALTYICRIGVGKSCAVFISIGAVLALECLNTAIEKTVDLITRGERSPLAKAAKDCAAGGVLIFSLAALAVGIRLFFNSAAINFALRFFEDKPYAAAAAAVFILLWLYWVFGGKTEKKDED